MADLAWFAIFGAVLLAGVGGGELLRGRLGWRPESSRRFVHAYTGVAVAGCPLLFGGPTWVYVLCAPFVAVNLWAIPRRALPGMHGIERKSHGTVVFPLALLTLAWGCWTVDPGRVFALQIAFVVLALSDPLASWIGGRVRRPIRFAVGAAEKSVAGSAAFLGSAFALVFAGLTVLDPIAGYGPGEHALAAGLVAALAAAAEMVGARGWDNLTIPLAVATPLVVLFGDPGALGGLLVAFAWAVGFGLLAFLARFLATDGALCASLLAFSVVGLGGWDWALPGFAFFVLSSALSKVGKKRKRSALKGDKGSRRDASQVLANGGLAWGLLLAHVYDPAPWLYWGFVGAFAAAAADTWATEIGTYFSAPTRSVWTWQRVPPGLSGGVSIPGSLAALLGAATVFAPVPLAAPERLELLAWPSALVIVVAGGFAGALFDSALGATAQALYRGPGTELTERAARRGVPNQLVRGVAWMDNERVNLACTMAGAGLVALGMGII